MTPDPIPQHYLNVFDEILECHEVRWLIPSVSVGGDATGFRIIIRKIAVDQIDLRDHFLNRIYEFSVAEFSSQAVEWRHSSAAIKSKGRNETVNGLVSGIVVTPVHFAK